MTPEGEKVRRIKNTLDDENEEIRDLYGALGLSADGAIKYREHQRQTITEPIQPMKSSSDLLQSLALQDRPGVLNEPPFTHRTDFSTSSSSWWGSSMTASIGRAARAVMDMSPPSKGASTFEEVARQFTGVGLGLAKGGEGVRKVKSNWELDRPRRSGSHSPPQEQRVPIPRFISERPKRRMSSDITPIEALMQHRPAIPFEDDAFGYSPLPQDYETQCEDDVDIIYSALDMYHTGSLGSTRSRTSTERGIDDDLILAVGDSTSTTSSMGDIGKKILENAVDYDEDFESPTISTFKLPVIDVEAAPRRPHTQRASTSPEPPSHTAPSEVLPSQPKLKYGDRASRLRMTQSTPALKQGPVSKPSWLSYLSKALGSEETHPSVAAIPPLPASGPLKISAPKLAAATVSQISPVVCDSASTDSHDLPAVPPAMSGFAWETQGPMTLRLKTSLATLKTAIVGGSPVVLEGNSPVLSPQVSWTEQGEHFAQWVGKDEHSVAEMPVDRRLESLRKSESVTRSDNGSIDYSKSFFYKPPTPPQQGYLARAESATQATPSKAPNPVARRQRSIKSLRQNLLLPTAPPPVPPIPQIHIHSEDDRCSTADINASQCRTPPRQPPILAISSPGACDAGLPPRQLILEGEEWDAKDEAGRPGEWGRRRKTKKRTSKKKKSSRAFDEEL